ncbi:hypothetical protein ACSBR2_014643 [Camellia fascicularis]
MITNIFWADHEMITDYELFGDVTVIFDASLLYDETIALFEWLFETFLHAMLGKKPSSFFTDQDQAMAKTIFEVMPKVFHGLYTFHLMQNALKHLAYLYKSGSKFGSDFKAIISGYEDEHE